MAIFHVATNTPPKSEVIQRWLGQQPWGPTAGTAVELIGSFHLDDPDGEVGMQVFVVAVGDELVQVPLTYRAAPEPELADALLGTIEHSVLGTRYVYDGLGDDRFVVVLAGVAAQGYGQALGFAQHEGRWYAVPDELLVRGAGQITGRIAVDGFAVEQNDGNAVVMRNDQLELTVYRSLADQPAPAIGLTATWEGHTDPVTLVELRQLG